MTQPFFSTCPRRFSKSVHCFVLWLIFQSCNTNLSAQQKTDASEILKQKFEHYSFLKKDDKLFLHTDKTLYTNNETIWFTAYLANAQSDKANAHHFLSVYLCQQDDDKILMEHRFIMEDGIAFGNITLPDTIVPGNYKLMAYTNVLGADNKPVALYRQQLTIKSVSDNLFTATSRVINPEAKDFFNVEVDLVAEKLKDDKKPVVSFLNQAGIKEMVKVNANGKYFIKIPLSEVKKFKDDLVVRIDYKNRVKYLTVKWPKPVIESVQVKFYPEGGSLVGGVVNQVAWEVKNLHGNAINTNALLYRGDEVLDTLKTEGYGIGKFKIIPDAKYTYSIKLIKAGKADTNRFALPEINASGVALNLKNAVVNDTLNVSLVCNKAQKLTVLVHNYNMPFAELPMQVSPGKLRFSVDLKAMPKGVGTITVLDSMQRPIIERLFFSHYNEKNTLTIDTDQKSYMTRDSTRVKIRLSDDQFKALQSGSVSVAVVQNNRIESDKQKRIDSYFLLDNELKGISTLEANLSYQHADYLENILLVKGWRKYVWSELAKVPDGSAADTLKNLLFNGSLSRYDAQIKKAASITLVSDSSFKLINTDAMGHFTLPYNDIVVSQGKKVWMMVNEKSKAGYKISIQEPAIKVAQYFDPQSLSTFETPENELNLKNNRAIVLNDVTIKGSKSDLLYKAPIPKVKTNLCGDYLCAFDHLNCQLVSHLYNTKIPHDGSYYLPTVNKTYTTKRSFGNSTSAKYVITVDRVQYTGCWLENKSVYELTKIGGIEISKEFYQPDATTETSEEDYASTTYWNHGIQVNDKGEVNFAFRNSKLADQFRIVIQGTSNNGVVYGEKEFKVKSN